MPEMHIERAGCCLVVCHTPNDVPDDEWTGLMGQIRSCLSEFSVCKILVSSQGRGGPNAKQRGSLRDATRGADVRVALLADSAFLRGILTAVEWTGALAISGFAPADEQAALSYLGIESVADVSEVRAILHRLKRLTS